MPWKKLKIVGNLRTLSMESLVAVTSEVDRFYGSESEIRWFRAVWRGIGIEFNVYIFNAC